MCVCVHISYICLAPERDRWPADHHICNVEVYSSSRIRSVPQNKCKYQNKKKRTKTNQIIYVYNIMDNRIVCVCVVRVQHFIL